MSDIWHGLRTHFRSPGFTLGAILVLALGIGASTAIFTLVKSLLLEALPYPESSRLVWIWAQPPHSGYGYNQLLGPDILEIRDHNQSFEKIAGLLRRYWNMTGAGEPQHLSGAQVTENFLETLGVAPILGRIFTADEYRTGHETQVIFSYPFWLNHFGSDPQTVGRHVTLDGISYQVVGIMPSGFPMGAEFDMWTPLPRESPYLSTRRFRTIRGIARLRPGVSLRQAQAEITARAADFSARYPLDREYSMRLVGFEDQELGGMRNTLWIFAAAVGSVLLIACSNLASLLLARGAVRMPEMAIRAALGARRIDLVRQLLIESSLLALAGGMLGYPLAVWGVRLLVALDPGVFPHAKEIHADARVLGFALLLSLLTGLVFGIVPALRASRVSLSDALKEGGRRGTAARQGTRFRAGLVIVEVTLGVILMTAAGLLARSFRALTDVHPGYETRNVLTMDIDLTDVRYRDLAECSRFFEKLVRQVEELPGVRAAGTTNHLPLQNGRNMTGIWLDSQPLHSPETRLVLDNRVVTPGYFSAMGIPLLAGRWFNWDDRPDTPNVFVVNDVFARQFFPNGNAVGQRITMDMRTGWVGQIVGVVGSIRESSIAEAPRFELFTTLKQTTNAGQTLVIRSNTDAPGLAAAVQRIIASLDKDVPAYGVRTMRERVSESIAQPHLREILLALLSALALLLASIGIYGVIACAMAERRKEIGIRMALGAQAGEVRRMMVVQGVKLTLTGLGLGLLAAAGTTRTLQGMLFGIGPGDPVTFAGTAAVFLTVAFIASYLPAWRATRVDPLTVLREE